MLICQKKVVPLQCLKTRQRYYSGYCVVNILDVKTIAKGSNSIKNSDFCEAAGFANIVVC